MRGPNATLSCGEPPCPDGVIDPLISSTCGGLSSCQPLPLKCTALVSSGFTAIAGGAPGPGSVTINTRPGFFRNSCTASPRPLSDLALATLASLIASASDCPDLSRRKRCTPAL